MSPLKFRSKQNRLLAALAATATLATIGFAPTALLAQSVRHYDYANIAVTYAVQKDSTVVVTEQQTYDFTGSYNQGERIIPHKGSGAITAVSVADSATGQPLTFAGSRALDKTNPRNWGKYTVTNSGGNTVIDWYYNLADTTHTWVLSYTLHGAITFAKDHDELYWNLFDSYTVPVLQTSATVVLPEADTQPTATFYVNGEHSVVSERPDDRTFHFAASNFAPGEAATVAVGWQKGMVTEQSYWLDFAFLYWQYLLAALLFAGSLLYALLYRAWTHPNRSGRTVIAAYEPPQNFDPMLAAGLLQRYSQKMTAAEIVSLAVRGYLTIQELPHHALRKQQYELTRTSLSTAALPKHEQTLLEGLFPSGTTFYSTEEASRSLGTQRFVIGQMMQADNEVTSALDARGLYAHSHADESKGAAYVLAPLAVVAVGVLVLFMLKGILPAAIVFGVLSIVPYAVLASSTFIAYRIIVYALRYELALNEAGRAARDALLGFKLYLSTAERYRMQNLTPETFEKYLPYAMLFGVEKKWSKAFALVAIAPPTWYGTPLGTPGTFGTSSAFSPAVFSSSFSASFSSAMSGGTGGGFSGGGGGAGGGGGGGGGGAS